MKDARVLKLASVSGRALCLSEHTARTLEPLAACIDFRLVLEIGQAAHQMTGERLAVQSKVIVAHVKPVQAAEQRKQRVRHTTA